MRLRQPVRLGIAAVGAAVLGVSAASALVPAPTVPAPQSAIPVAGSERLGPTAADPLGGIDWALRAYTSTSGGSCVEVGRLTDGRFAEVDAAGTYRAAPLGEGGTCGDLAAEPVIVAVNAYPARADRGARTVLFGLAAPAVAGLLVQRPGGAVGVRPVIGATRGFLLPLAGTIAASELPVTITLADGRSRMYDWR
ncbi:MAG: hypothetical protein QOD24_1130 [Solirubrobacteraceae bacterium]|nr:hypothetical protein [Solirubrobacteraceae bacterium]